MSPTNKNRDFSSKKDRIEAMKESAKEANDTQREMMTTPQDRLNWEERYDHMTEENEFWGITYAEDNDKLIKSFIHSLLSSYTQDLREKVEEITVIGVGAIPETNDYANGWNACRQEYYSRKFKPFRDSVLSLLTSDTNRE